MVILRRSRPTPRHHGPPDRRPELPAPEPRPPDRVRRDALGRPRGAAVRRDDPHRPRAARADRGDRGARRRARRRTRAAPRRRRRRGPGGGRGGARERDDHRPVRGAGAARHRGARARVGGADDRRPPRPLPGRRRARGDAVRGGGRAARVPLLRRARVQGALEARRGGTHRGLGAVERRPGERGGSRRAPPGPVRRDAAAADVPHRARARPDRRAPAGLRARRPGPDLRAAREARPHRVRAGRRRRGAAAARGLLRRPVRVREARPGRAPGVRGGRDGERRPRHLPGGRAAPRSADRLARAEEARRGGGHPRARAPVVRELGDDVVVGRPVAERGVRHLDGVQDRRPLEPGLARLAGVRPGEGGGDAPRRAALDPPRPGGDPQRRGGGRGVRPHHLREGRRGAPDDRGLPRRGALPRRHPPLHAPAREGERRRGRPLARARRGVERAGGGARERLDRRARVPGHRGRADGARAAPLAAALLLRAGHAIPTRRCGRCRSCCAAGRGTA